MLALHIFTISKTSQVFINFAMGNFGMEDIPINSEEESDGPGSIKAAEA